MMQSNTKPAGFLRRLLANIIDTWIWFLPISFGVFLLATQAKVIQDLFTGIIYYLTFVILPLTISSIFFYPLLNSKFGGSPGKLITGLQVVDENGKFLNFRLAFFRETVGRLFSALFFWLGYLSIIKDPEKRAWHDKATGSQVIVVQTLWPIALVVLLILAGVNFYLISSSINKYNSSNLGIQLTNLEGELFEDTLNDTGDKTDLNWEFSKTYANALELLANKDYGQVINLEQSLIQNAALPEDKSMAYSLLAEVYYNQGEDTKAEDYAKKSLDFNGEDVYANALLASLEYQDENYLAAENYARIAILVSERDNYSQVDNAYNYFILGLALDAQGKTAQGLKEIKKAIELDPTNQEYQDTLESF